MKAGAAAALALLGAACASTASGRIETVAVPGTDVRFEMVHVGPGGSLRPFWISRREVTWAEFDRFYEGPDGSEIDAGTHPSRGKDYVRLSGMPPDFFQPDRPAVSLRYHSALAYGRWLSRKTGLYFRLPTETEWETACGPAPEPLGESAWLASNSGDRLHRAGDRKPNALGIYDMLGNAWEYCLEPLRPPAFDPVLRGGAWNSPSDDLGRRKAVPPEWSEADPNRPVSPWWFRSDFSQGFRLVRVPGPGAARKEYAKKIEVRIPASKEPERRHPAMGTLLKRVTGEVRNGGDRVLDEVELTVYYLTPEGRPHPRDVGLGGGYATFNLCYPVLVNSAHPGEHRRPLGPGESRSFTVDLFMSQDVADDVQADGFGGTASNLRFSGE
jgi:hypothetical protein